MVLRLLVIVWLIVLTVVVATFYKDYHFVDPTLYESVRAKSDRDALSVAVQLGRLDLLSVMIGLLSFVVALATLFGFWFYRNVVESTAKVEVGVILPQILERYIRENPGIIVKAFKNNKSILDLVNDENGTDFSSEIATAISTGDGGDENGE